jgi:hypothetical protein
MRVGRLGGATLRAGAVCIGLALAASACGRYGPPVRRLPPPEAGASGPAAEAPEQSPPENR